MYNTYMCIDPQLEIDISINFECLCSFLNVQQDMASTKAKTVATGAAGAVVPSKVGLPDKVEDVVHMYYYCLSA